METTTSTIQASPTMPSGDWSVDPARSRVRFHTRAMFGILPVVGQLERFGGVLHVEDSGQATGDLRIESASIGTGINHAGLCAAFSSLSFTCAPIPA